MLISKDFDLLTRRMLRSKAEGGRFLNSLKRPPFPFSMPEFHNLLHETQDELMFFQQQHVVSTFAVSSHFS